MTLALGQSLGKAVRKGAAKGLNTSGDDLAGRAIGEAPVDSGELRASAAYPAVDPTHAASEDNLSSTVSFNRPYAAAQHEGEIVYQDPVTYVVHEHTRITPGGGLTVVREHTATIGPGVVELRNHPRGGKSHYLSDPHKQMFNEYEKMVALEVEAAVTEWAKSLRLA